MWRIPYPFSVHRAYYPFTHLEHPLPIELQLDQGGDGEEAKDGARCAHGHHHGAPRALAAQQQHAGHVGADAAEQVRQHQRGRALRALQDAAEDVEEEGIA